MKILIDGYNLIFQCGLQGRSAGSDALERARNRLLGELKSRMDEATRKKTTIVFDARNRPVKQVSDYEKIHEIQVIYAASHPDADSLIEELIRKHSTPKKLTVVSSDHRIQRAAARRNSRALDSDHWFDQPDLSDSKTNDAQDSDNFEDEKPDLPNFNPFPPGYAEDL